jgi:predicted Rdx family selenoprotein
VTLQRSGGGVFEIRIDDRIAYSKRALGRFPSDAEIIGLVT